MVPPDKSHLSLSLFVTTSCTFEHPPSHSLYYAIAILAVSFKYIRTLANLRVPEVRPQGHFWASSYSRYLSRISLVKFNL